MDFFWQAGFFLKMKSGMVNTNYHDEESPILIEGYDNDDIWRAMVEPLKKIIIDTLVFLVFSLLSEWVGCSF